MTSTFKNSMDQRVSPRSYGRFTKRKIDTDLLDQLRSDVEAERRLLWTKLNQVASPEVVAFVDSLIHERCGRYVGLCVCKPSG